MKFKILMAAIVLAVVVLAAVTVFEPVLAEDAAWCRMNYSVGRLVHCMVYENSIFGRWLQP